MICEERTMLDWNGNGKIDPVDVGISIAAQTQDEDPGAELGTEEVESRPGTEQIGKAQRAGSITAFFKRVFGWHSSPSIYMVSDTGGFLREFCLSLSCWLQLS